MKKTKSFTMAEILLSLAVIGIIAAMTLPTLTANFQDRAFNAKRQALHARLSNALRTLDFEDYLPLGKFEWGGVDRDQETYPNIDQFMNDLTKELSIKLINNDDSEIIFGNRKGFESAGSSYYSANDYNIAKNNWYFPLSGESLVGFAGYRNRYFQTVNGESIGILFNESVSTSDKKYPGKSMCFLLVYDLNGTKGPNKWGKDMGVMGAFYYENLELYAPMLGAITDNPINPDCNEDDSSCQKYKYPDLRLASIEEIATLNSLYGAFIPIQLDTSLCAIDGKQYTMRRIWDVDNGNSTNANTDEDESCLYLLVTNDGSAPKNGYVVDISSDDSGE